MDNPNAGSFAYIIANIPKLNSLIQGGLLILDNYGGIIKRVLHKHKYKKIIIISEHEDMSIRQIVDENLFASLFGGILCQTPKK